MIKILKLTIYLGIITFVSGSILLLVNNQTFPSIQKQTISAKEKALQIVMPTAAKFSGTNNRISFNEQILFKALNKKNQLMGYVFATTPQGYSGPIKMFVGIANKKITGVTILSHTETPGLGALAESPKKLTGKKFSFLGQFIKKSITDRS